MQKFPTGAWVYFKGVMELPAAYSIPQNTNFPSIVFVTVKYEISSMKILCKVRADPERCSMSLGETLGGLQWWHALFGTTSNVSKEADIAS